MSDPATPAAAPPAAGPPKWQTWLTRGVGILLFIIGTVLGGTKVFETFTLPSCESKRTLDVIRAIFKEKELPEPKLTGAQDAGSSGNEKSCTVSYELPNESGTLEYRVFWEGWTAKVQITKVNS
jgi:hypothetical protein